MNTSITILRYPGLLMALLLFHCILPAQITGEERFAAANEAYESGHHKIALALLDESNGEVLDYCRKQGRETLNSCHLLYAKCLLAGNEIPDALSHLDSLDPEMLPVDTDTLRALAYKSIHKDALNAKVLETHLNKSYLVPDGKSFWLVIPLSPDDSLHFHVSWEFIRNCADKEITRENFLATVKSDFRKSRSFAILARNPE